MAASRRLFKELRETKADSSSDADIKLTCDENNVYRWTALIKVGGLPRFVLYLRLQICQQSPIFCHPFLPSILDLIVDAIATARTNF